MCGENFYVLELKKKTNIALLGYFWWAATCASPRPRCGRLAAWWESTTLRLVSGWPEFRLLKGSGLIIWRSRTLTSHYVAKGRSPENACASLSSSRRHEDRLWIFFFAGRLVQVVKRWMYPWCVFFAFFFFLLFLGTTESTIATRVEPIVFHLFYDRCNGIKLPSHLLFFLHWA